MQFASCNSLSSSNLLVVAKDRGANGSTIFCQLAHNSAEKQSLRRYLEVGLPKKNRLTHRRDFSAVYRQGTRFSSSHLVLRTLPIAASPLQTKLDRSQHAGEVPALWTRIGIVVSQKVDKRAVVRNQIKRRLQAAFMTLRSHIKPGWLLVIGVRPQAVQCEYEQFLQELKQLLADAEVFNGN